MNYELCLELARKLEVLKESGLQNKPVVDNLAGFIYRYNITDLRQLNELAEVLISAGGGWEDDGLLLTPESILRGESLGEDLAPWARNLRKRLFGEAEAPCSNYKSAVRWMKEYDAEKHAIDFGPSIRTYQARRNIRYFESDDTDTIMFARINSPLEKIIFASQKLVRELEIGLEWNSVVFYVLADIPPFIPPVEMGIHSYYVSLPSGRQAKFREATVKIREGFDLTYLRWMYDSIRQSMQLTKKKGVTARHLELCRLVKQKGGVPHGKGTVAFWMSVTEEWNKSHPKSKYKTWKGVKIAYERVMSKLRPAQTDNGSSISISNQEQGGTP